MKIVSSMFTTVKVNLEVLVKNVSYEFTFVETVLSSEETSDNVVDNLVLDTKLVTNTKVTYRNEDGEEQKSEDIPEIKVRNYSDAYMCSNFLGYQRDEIYRFGIIFF